MSCVERVAWRDGGGSGGSMVGCIQAGLPTRPPAGARGPSQGPAAAL